MEKRSRLSLFRLAAGLTGSQVAALLQNRFRLVDKTVISKAEHPELYGVELSKEAWAVLEAEYPQAAQRAKNRAQGRKADRHKKTRRITVRVAEGDFSMLQQRLEAEGLTVQDVLSGALVEYVAGGASDGNPLCPPSKGEAFYGGASGNPSEPPDGRPTSLSQGRLGGGSVGAADGWTENPANTEWKGGL